MAAMFCDHLRSLGDDDLAELIRLRPDLVMPVPADLSALAVHAQSRLSVARALDGLDTFTLQILDALRLTVLDGLTSVEAVIDLAAGQGSGSNATPDQVRAAVEALRRRCVVYGPPGALRIVPTVEEVCSQYLAGLGRPAAELDPEAAVLVADAARLRRTLLAATPQARAVLDRLAEGPPLGTVSAASLAPEAGSTVRALVDAHLLVRVSADAVELPREVGLLLRRETGPLGVLAPRPPVPATTVREAALVDQAGAGQALEAVRCTEVILEALAAEPPGVLRSGGLGVRDLRRLARLCGVDEPSAALLIEVAAAAGLIGDAGAESGDAVHLPAAGYDAWLASGMAARWLRLAAAWLAMARDPALVGQRDDRRLVNVLAPEVERAGAPARRRAVLQVLADAPPGTAIGPEDIVAALTWREPRRATRAAASGVASAVAEAATLGLTALGALTGYGRLLLAEPEEEADGDPLGIGDGTGAPQRAAQRALHELLPPLVDHVLLQADLSVVVPGPPEPTLAAELTALADRESASVYRITATSVRRALDLGYAAADLHELLARRSRTPVPQPVRYLVDDVARQHGGMRAGPAAGYLRSDDEALLAEVVADRRLAGVGLRRIAPTVLVSPMSVPRLLAALREAGYAPVAEDAMGGAVLARPRMRRAAARPPLPARQATDPIGPPRLSAARLAGVVEQLRRGEAAARARRQAPAAVRAPATGATATQAHTEALAVLQQALRDRTMVWVGYVDAHGTAASRLLRPASMGGGYLRAEDERTGTVHTFALHRITAAVAEEP